jgi:succinate-semialdehyde dehydrogenase/glutarate-semialdehyde dehydrogenase
MKMIINGQKRDSSNNRVVEIINPFNQELLDTVPSATEEDLELALEHVSKGKRVWRETPLYKRSKILLQFTEKVREHREELSVLLCKETGKTIKEAMIELNSVQYIFRSFIEQANHLYGITIPDSQPGGEKDIIFTRREPLGVVVCIIPFNYPALTYAYKVAPALITGNSVIIKPPSDNPMTLIRITELLLECGVPENAVQIVTGSGSVIGKYLVESSKTDAVSLTGSTKVGIETAKSAAGKLHRVFLELGGNDALIVFEDGDIESAVKEAVISRTMNAGQACIASKRFIVHNSIKDEFTRLLVEKLSTLTIGDPLNPKTDMGCLINENAAKEVKKQVDLTIKQGANCIYGGNILNKTFFQPTVLEGVTPDMDIAKDMEVFGPVFPIIGFDNEEEAISIHNSSAYGLNGGIITNDINKALRVADKLECGGVVINGSGIYRHPDIAFGGYKMSGIGREGVSATLEELTQVKTIVMKGILK